MNQQVPGTSGYCGHFDHSFECVELHGDWDSIDDILNSSEITEESMDGKSYYECGEKCKKSHYPIVYF